MSNSLENLARQGELIVMAGAGVSAGKPTALPGWKAANAAIVQVLGRRLESALCRPGWLSQLVPVIDADRDADCFPPDYQAQLIEEMCGDRYFRALQALDVDVINAGHDGIAVLAKAGAVKAVVTTNFDRLIERALDKRGVQYVVAYDDDGYLEMLQRLAAGALRPLPILKIHGCVSNHRSMIDTLKQRKRGRSRHLRECLDALRPGYWIYLGFSAADLETDPSYLGLVAGAAASSGATYVAYPGNPALGRGATTLMDAYGNRGQVVVAHVPAYLGQECRVLGIPGPVPIPDDAALGPALFQSRLEAWADGLSPAAAGLCLAAILEAIGHAEPAVRILDRLVRNELYEFRGTPDFRALQLHYGRMGAAWGRFVAVPDLNGEASNASVETVQSLLRILDSELAFTARSWLVCLWLWRNDGRQATGMAIGLFNGFVNGQWDGAEPRGDEEAVDAWLSAAQVAILNNHEHMVNLAVGTAGEALERAKRSGDVVRTARVAALKSLVLAESSQDVPGLLAQHDPDFRDAARVGDGFALGMRALAHGRWLVGVGGLSQAKVTDSTTVARQALAQLTEAIRFFRNQGLDPWVLFARVQQAKAYADLGQIDNAQTCIEAAAVDLERFSILVSHVHEAVGQVRKMVGAPDALKSFQAAQEAAEQSGLLFRRETLLTYMS